nr:MAG TPA: hypothetical protein [Caudoviricetes sp.]DAN25129.1 MAG TPA: hypothetical protein [Caudoviricetes sp.]DAS11912.1 MAG TPA: hypothetical protein [Caudoviricetes sp.]DAS89002.1 MAG TPA: hypothetical protein [Caudoviricetes sp.]DAZ78799.1 MAG TPA: hypothetical protein [Caudoviricetes sp.]
MGVIAYALFLYPLDCFVQWRINYWVGWIIPQRANIGWLVFSYL